MKNKIIIILAVGGMFFSSCEHQVVLNTKVHEDGSVDKVITLMKADSAQASSNVFGIGESQGWDVHFEQYIERDTTKEKAKSNEINIEFSKSFASVDEMNKDLDQNLDTLFRIYSTFEKKFRWFYTYINYSETFRPIDRLKMIEASDYFTQEDLAFIDRLPGEGTAISKADSLYLQLLNEKIFENYGARGVFNEQFEVLKRAVKENVDNENWVDTLAAKKEWLYQSLVDEKFSDLFDIAVISKALHIPLDTVKAKNDIERFSTALEHRMNFMSYARDGKYINSIEMPWPVVRSNADSVAGNTLYWKPLATKFAIKEFAMMAESRQFNWWAAALTAVLIGGTIILFVRKKQ